MLLAGTNARPSPPPLHGGRDRHGIARAIITPALSAMAHRASPKDPIATNHGTASFGGTRTADRPLAANPPPAQPCSPEEDRPRANPHRATITAQASEDAVAIDPARTAASAGADRSARRQGPPPQGAQGVLNARERRRHNCLDLCAAPSRARPVTFCDDHRTVFATANGRIQLTAGILAAAQVVLASLRAPHLDRGCGPAVIATAQETVDKEHCR